MAHGGRIAHSMQTIYKPSMLLFSKGIEQYPSRHILYFVEQETLGGEAPILHRFEIRRTDFERYAIGCVYDLQARGNRIEGALLTGEDALEPELFLPLIERRDLQFMPLSAARQLRRKGRDFFDENDYYSYEETRELLEYETSWANDFVSWLVFASVRGLAMLLPVALYLFTVYVRINSLSYAGSKVGQILAVPVYALTALIFMAFLMMALGVGAETLTMHWDVTRWYLLKRAVLRNSGKRVSVNPSKARIRKLIIFGSVSFGLLLLVLVIFALNDIR